MRQLTVLSDKSNAAVDYNRDAVFGQLLVTERSAVCAGSQRDCRVPQRKVHPAEPVDVNCPAEKMIISAKSLSEDHPRCTCLEKHF